MSTNKKIAKTVGAAVKNLDKMAKFAAKLEAAKDANLLGIGDDIRALMEKTAESLDAIQAAVDEAAEPTD